MTSYRKFLLYTGTSLAILLPFPGRIVYGIFALVHFTISVILLTLMLHAINKMAIKSLRLGICSLELVALTIFFKELLVIFCPIAALTVGFSFYLPAVSSVAVVMLNFKKSNSIRKNCLENLKKSSVISAFCLLVFSLRDILGFGTITLPKWQSPLIIKLPELPFLHSCDFVTAFFATIPGCLVLTVLVFYLALKFGVKKCSK